MPKNIRGRDDLILTKKKLQEYAGFLEKTITSLELNKIEVTKEILKDRFRQEFKSEKKGQFIYFTDFVDDFIIKAPDLVNRSTKEKYTVLKITEYKNSNNRIKEFEKEVKKRIRINGFTLKVYDELVEYFRDKRGYSINTIGMYIKNIRVFLKILEEKSYTVHADYKKASFANLKEESVSIALNEDEIEQIFNYDFSDNKRLENCRDLMIIGLWTGLRVSDFLSLPVINENDKFITVEPQKTKKTSGKKVVIPLHHHIKEVIKKRGMPKAVSKIKFNLQIKEVGKIVGLTEEVKGSIGVQDNKNDRYRKKTGVYPKYKLMSSHTCRRSFATNLYKMNFPTLSIMQITGHTTEKSFLTYIKVTPTEHAEKLLEHWEMYYRTKQKE
ncbi:tyrosine-type recombinase/integrase [Tenacibaculum sp. nBUS_03]|uniref:tyrosine-type recombinase/integrase n=1 Tax=Tenacibaculum sp. nBUS_03 TaxID=3395320 RepID=UPI003EBC07F7